MSSLTNSTEFSDGDRLEMSLRRAQMESIQARSRWIEGSMIAGFWLFIFLLTAGQRALDPRSPDGLNPDEVVHVGLEYLVWLLLTPGIFWLSRRFAIDNPDWPKHLGIHLAAALVVAVGIDFFAGWTLGIIMPWHPWANFNPGSRIVNFRFLDELFIYFVVLAGGIARDFFWRFRERQLEAARLREQAVGLEARLADARLHALRMQINPHFLFNTLHAVSTLVERDPAGVRRMIARLSELLRYTLEGSGSQEVTLMEELQFLRGYLEIQRIRFQGRLEVAEFIEDETLDAKLPSMILQPLVENAVKHGVGKIDELGRIELRAYRENGTLVVSVHDNGPGIDALPDEPLATSGVGLRNTCERLEMLYGGRDRLLLERSHLGGLIARITIPFHTSSDLHTSLVEAYS